MRSVEQKVSRQSQPNPYSLSEALATCVGVVNPDGLVMNAVYEVMWKNTVEASGHS